MRNTLGDLNLHLFEQLERLNDEDLTGDDLKDEIERAKMITSVSGKIIDNAALVLQAKKIQDTALHHNLQLPKMLEG